MEKKKAIEAPATERKVWRVRVAAGHGFTRTHGPYNLRFTEGVAETDNKAAADHAAECGYEVTDLGTKEVRNPLHY